MKQIMFAIQGIAQDYGIREIAGIIRTKADNLRKKLNPNDESHQLTLTEFVHISTITGKPDGLLALAAELGYVCVRMTNALPTDMNQICFLDLMLELGESKGDVCTEIRKALKDGRICANDAKAIKNSIYQMQCDLAEIEQSIDACLENQKQGSRK